MLKVGSDFSGVGAFECSLNRLKIDYINVFACEQDKYARETYLLNHDKPLNYFKDVYKRKIPEQSLDLYMTSPPCQSFSLAGKKLGKEDKRGILFFNSLEFIKKNRPKFFIIENVTGLMHIENGAIFDEWLYHLGGKSINGLPVLFPAEDSAKYHVYYRVLNAKNFGVAQNRDRVFIVGIRDDQDNVFQYPKEIPLTKKLKNYLQRDVEKKYFLRKEYADTFVMEKNYYHNNCVGNIHPSGNGMSGKVYSIEGIAPTVTTNKGEGIKIISYNNGVEYIRRLTPHECFLLMDFPEDFKFNCSNNQAYKQSGNSIVVACLSELIKKLKL